MRIVERFVTQASPDVVWHVLADVEHWPDWSPTVLKIEPLTSGGLRVGARYRVTQPKLRPAVYEVTDCIPNRAFTWVQKMPGGSMIADHRISSVGAATEVELSFSTEGWLGSLVGKIFSKQIAEYVATEARSLKSRSEALSLMNR